MHRNIHHFLTFCQIIESGSFAAAARTLGISRAAVSQQLAHLESDLGVQLVERTTRRLWLTEAGSMIYEEARQLADKLSELESTAESLGAEASGQLNVLSGRHFAQAYILPHLRTFTERFPKVHLHLQLEERMPDWESPNLDVVIGYNIEAPENFIQRSIGRCRYKLVATRRYLDKAPALQRPSDLFKHRYIGHTMRRPNNVVRFKDQNNVTVFPHLLISDVEAMKEAALQDLGLIWVHDYAVRDELDKGALCAALETFEEPDIQLRYYFRERRQLPPKLRVFLDFISEILTIKTT